MEYNLIGYGSLISHNSLKESCKDKEFIPVTIKNYKLLTKALISIDHIICIDKSNHPPNKSYFMLCREAAYHISKEFGKVWDETTFNSSGKKVSDWIKQHPKYDTIN